MTETLAAPRRLWPAAALGLTAAMFSLGKPPAGILVPLAAALAAALAAWTLGTPTRWLAVFFCAALLLPPLPFALGDSGPHPALLIAALGLVAGLWRLPQWRIPIGGLSRAMALFFFVLLFSIALAAVYSGIPIAAASLARVLLFGISVYVFFYLTCGPGQDSAAGDLRTARIVFLAATAAALFACADFYFQFPTPAGFSPQFVWLDTGVYRRAQGLFYEASTLGNFCAFFLVMIAVALLRPRAERPASRPALLGAGAVFTAALLFSYSRASILTLAVAGAALLALEPRRFRLGRAAFAIVPAAAAAAAVTYFAAPALMRVYWLRLTGSAAYLFTATGTVLSGRLASWQALADFLRMNPWHALLGVGYKTLPYSDFTGRPVIADNMYLSLLVETGILGLAALAVLHAAILRAAWCAAKSADRRASFFGTWIFCFWCGEIVQMFSGDLLTYWRVLPLYFWALAAAVRASHDHSLP